MSSMVNPQATMGLLTVSTELGLIKGFVYPSLIKQFFMGAGLYDPGLINDQDLVSFFDS